ncbi:MAG: hypothetical protein AAGA71_06205 [Pseudomonadota bacterium]
MTSVTARYVASATKAVKERNALIAAKGLAARLREEKGAVAVAPEACAQHDADVAELQAEVERLTSEVTKCHEVSVLNEIATMRLFELWILNDPVQRDVFCG